MDVSDLAIEPAPQRGPLAHPGAIIFARVKPWIGGLLAGLAAVGWLWAALRFWSTLAELAARQTALTVVVIVALVFFTGAVPAFFALRDRRPRAALLAREEIDTDPTLPAPPPPPPRARTPRAVSRPPVVAVDPDAADTVPPTGPKPPDDKEYF